MADASETLATEQDVSPEAAEKMGDLEKTNGGEEVTLQKVEEFAPEGSAESSGDKAVEEVERESKPEDLSTAETVVVAMPEVVETVPDVKPEAEVVGPEAKTEEQADVETILEVKQEDEPVKEVAVKKLEEESIRIVSEARILEEEAAEAVPEEVIKEPKEVAEGENVQEVSEKAVVEEALEEKAAVAEAEVTDPVKPEKKQSRNVISRMKRSLSKVKKAFAGKSPGSKRADSNAKAEGNAE